MFFLRGGGERAARSVYFFIWEDFSYSDLRFLGGKNVFEDRRLLSEGGKGAYLEKKNNGGL